MRKTTVSLEHMGRGLTVDGRDGNERPAVESYIQGLGPGVHPFTAVTNSNTMMTSADTRSRMHKSSRCCVSRKGYIMTPLIIIVAIIAIILLFVGGFVQAVQWLLWVGIVLLIIAIIVWLLRFITGRRNTSV